MTKIHFIGICGISMKALAKLSEKLLNAEITGSDCNMQEISKLKKEGLNVYVGEKDFIDANIVVYSSAIAKDNKELCYAKKNNIIVYERSEYINFLSLFCKEKIFISGAHGKSTTTALIMHCLNKMNKKFIGHVGADFIEYNENYMYKGEEFFISEACEYNKNFLKLTPNILAILNIDYDHPDTYKDIEDVENTYYDFAKRTKDYVILPYEYKERFNKLNANLITFGKDKADYTYNIEKNTLKIQTKNKIYTIKTNLINKLNVNNIVVAFIILRLLRISLYKINCCFNSFEGLKRRYEYLGKINNANIYTDYAHHPKEIEELILKIKREDSTPLIIFQPHTYSRTKSLFSEFIDVLRKIDNLILLPTFASREKSDDEPVYDLMKNLVNARFVGNLESLKILLLSESKKYRTIFIVGAGDGYKVYDLLKNYMDNMVNI